MCNWLLGKCQCVVNCQELMSAMRLHLMAILFNQFNESSIIQGKEDSVNGKCKGYLVPGCFKSI